MPRIIAFLRMVGCSRVGDWWFSPFASGGFLFLLAIRLNDIVCVGGVFVGSGDDLKGIYRINSNTYFKIGGSRPSRDILWCKWCILLWCKLWIRATLFVMSNFLGNVICRWKFSLSEWACVGKVIELMYQCKLLNKRRNHSSKRVYNKKWNIV